MSRSFRVLWGAVAGVLCGLLQWWLWVDNNLLYLSTFGVPTLLLEIVLKPLGMGDHVDGLGVLSAGRLVVEAMGFGLAYCGATFVLLYRFLGRAAPRHPASW